MWRKHEIAMVAILVSSVLCVLTDANCTKIARFIGCEDSPRAIEREIYQGAADAEYFGGLYPIDGEYFYKRCLGIYKNGEWREYPLAPFKTQRQRRTARELAKVSTAFRFD